jgi:hypothetical protein
MKKTSRVFLHVFHAFMIFMSFFRATRSYAQPDVVPQFGHL